MIRRRRANEQPEKFVDVISRKGQPQGLVKVKKLMFKDYPLSNVSSSFIQKIGYKIVGRELIVDLNGRGYEYYSVPFNIFEGLYYAMSKGTYYNLKIKGKFKQRRIY